MKILVIEDNESVCTMLEMFFLKESYQSEFVHNGLEGYDRFRSGDWDLLIIDWMLPGMDGVSLCKKIREVSQVPIILLTAKDSESEQVLGLEMGADDYVTKPFSPLTLLARIRAVTRRSQQDLQAHKKQFLQTKHFKLSKETRKVFLDGEEITNLTPKEYDLLLFFIQNQRQVFSREQLLDKVWGYQYYGDERTVDVHVKKLRKKIDSPSKSFIYTIWGVGYQFDELKSKVEN